MKPHVTQAVGRAAPGPCALMRLVGAAVLLPASDHMPAAQDGHSWAAASRKAGCHDCASPGRLLYTDEMMHHPGACELPMEAVLAQRPSEGAGHSAEERWLPDAPPRREVPPACTVWLGWRSASSPMQRGTVGNCHTSGPGTLACEKTLQHGVSGY
ncbi:hypothetical protein NDU88_006543 [Pleurodeles waltl]|uniref:Uncharacterized protein n=1 Tax=Pleurodeles waltl TaxID=8319 RepID=A0AAV7X1Y8_PLEWA|nr:hypothetical protein NDU88_006543 [Pleurodeles waltl]